MAALLVGAGLLGVNCARGAPAASGTSPSRSATRAPRVVAGHAATASGCQSAVSGAPTPAQTSVSLQEGAPMIVRINQLGYVAGCPKLALAMTRHRVSARRFTLTAPDRRVAYRGLADRPQRWNASYTVYPLDFSALTAPGTYVLHFGGGRSAPLRVGAAGMYRSLADATLAFLQSQRDGPFIIPGALRRQPSHVGETSAPVYRVPAYRGTTLAGGATPTGAHVDVSGGWFDAGDYLKFVETASFTDSVLLYTARDYTGAVSQPASLLAEARYGTDWLMKMWDQQQRVLYAQVGLGDGNGRTVLGDHDLWRLPQADDRGSSRVGSGSYLATHPPVFAANAPGHPISPNLAGRLAGVFGLCAQVFAGKDPSYAARCLLYGQTIFDQANTRPRGQLFTTVPHAYYNESEWRDDMQFGATELYLGTARAGASSAGLPHPDRNFYLQPAGRWADAYITARGSGQDSFNLYDVSSLADADLVRVLATPEAQQYILHGPASVNVPTDAGALLRDRRDQLALATRLARRDPFGLANPASPVDTVPHALGYAVESRLYDALASTNSFESLAQRQLSWVLGANAWGSSFVVGVGSVFPHCLAAQIPNLSGSLNGTRPIALGAVVDGATAISNLRGIGAPDGHRACPSRGRSDPYRRQTGHGMAYIDDVRSSDTSEPTDDYAAVALLAAAQQAAAG
jgi:endoglucanase